MEAARNGSFTDLEKIGYSIGIPELAREINRTTDHAMRNRKQVSGTYYVNQDAYQQYGIYSISFYEWPSGNGNVKQLHFTFRNNRCPLPPIYTTSTPRRAHPLPRHISTRNYEIGRASCRERV